MEVSEITGQRRPIGYWVKHLHELTESSFEDLLAEKHLTRRHWQVMNVVVGEPTTVEAVDTELSPFLTAEQPSLRPLVENLRGRGWLDGDETLSLTEAGRRAHADLLEKVTATRARLTDGISVEEYQATIDVLSRMSANMRGQ
ncbi:DNA-binding MarR family transcriptional regulator [Streptosporangium album]|uniref:DNA-binding MarR family transcriptional regulator n=1 Tax=Streptosporangium album TaxID=47479 RepID=A0A7W7W8G6_9ACTN|nr:MarR family transcriptional regulator [Streptosporangium album]MBB4938292.1 DNA-binding MarR family transcriptional regulator [Streptosporangium album]